MTKRNTFPNRIIARQEDARKRLAERAERTDTEQLEKLVNEGHAHCQEARGLTAKLAGGMS